MQNNIPAACNDHVKPMKKTIGGSEKVKQRGQFYSGRFLCLLQKFTAGCHTNNAHKNHFDPPVTCFGFFLLNNTMKFTSLVTFYACYPKEVVNELAHLSFQHLKKYSLINQSLVISKKKADLKEAQQAHAVLLEELQSAERAGAKLKEDFDEQLSLLNKEYNAKVDDLVEWFNTQRSKFTINHSKADAEMKNDVSILKVNKDSHEEDFASLKEEVEFEKKKKQLATSKS